MAIWELWQSEESDGEGNGPDIAPVPRAYAEAVREMVSALAKGSALFVVSAEPPERTDGLTLARLQRCVTELPACSDSPRVWPLLEDTFLVALPLNGPPDDPFNAVHIQSVRRMLAAQLQSVPPPPHATKLLLISDADSGEANEADREPGWSTGEESTGADAPHDLSLRTVDEIESEQDEIAPPEVLKSLLATPKNGIRILPLAQLGQTESIEQNIGELNALLEVILNKQLHTQFQPIVSLRDGTALGHEALIRGPKNAIVRRPGAMFRTADKAHLVAWFDLACQEHCFATAAKQGLKSLLFVNMDAEGLAYCDDAERSLGQRARDAGLTPARIVIEVTERQTVGDFPRLLRYLARLRDEGFKIAIDDAGAGYSSLNAIAEVRPDFVKLDKTLIRGLHRSGERRALLLALLAYTGRMGAALIAEGIESQEELAVLVDCGVPFAQGYLLARPADVFRGVPRVQRSWIVERAQAREAVGRGQKRTVGKLAVSGRTLPPDAPLSQAAQTFAKLEGLTSITIVEAGCVRGVLMRSQLEHVLAVTRASQMDEVLPAQSVGQWMLTDVFTARVGATVPETARQILARSDISLDTDVIVTTDGSSYFGTLPTRLLLEASLAP